jgi:ribulose-phosphate 3-epimerase
MGVIIPAILPKSRDDLAEKLARFTGLTDFIQIDVVDGAFAAPASWPYAEGARALGALSGSGAMLPRLGEFKYEIDLMVANPEESLASWVALGASRIAIHAESAAHLSTLIGDFGARFGHERDFAPDLLSLGLAINLDTDVHLIDPYLGQIDYVQFMGIASIGKQGQPFDVRVVDRIRDFKRQHPQMAVQIDGAVTRETAPALLDAGADRLVVGHALLEAPDLRKEFQAFTELTERYGLYG